MARSSGDTICFRLRLSESYLAGRRRRLACRQEEASPAAGGVAGISYVPCAHGEPSRVDSKVSHPDGACGALLRVQLGHGLWRDAGASALQDGVVVKPSDYEYMTGNLPVLSKELAMGTDDDLMPGWVQLRDPLLQRLFWWNIFHRSRRDARPSPLDDGSRGAGRGEAEGRSLAAAYLAHIEAGE